MKSCITCFYQGDNNVDVNGEGKVFCMVDCKWRKEQDFCSKFVDYADLSKEIRCKYAMKENGENNSITSIIKANWYVMIATFIIAFLTFLVVVKFFDRYIF
ncbi:MAG: hypothetical protein WCS83_03230 [Endomicrobiia bacterium]|nr:hypothetical protein [Endomicrobiaceae bacterium]MDD3053131.1 hypothetical protein [Endomicrobiaceae bacterium]MDD3922206.1 hypothetical protein [Endomicrobiaceae bacterium]MDD5102460.1 hypothetical protein [Endomicrobiaceae bacterium]